MWWASLRHQLDHCVSVIGMAAVDCRSAGGGLCGFEDLIPMVCRLGMVVMAVFYGARGGSGGTQLNMGSFHMSPRTASAPAPSRSSSTTEESGI